MKKLLWIVCWWWWPIWRGAGGADPSDAATADRGQTLCLRSRVGRSSADVADRRVRHLRRGHRAADRRLRSSLAVEGRVGAVPLRAARRRPARAALSGVEGQGARVVSRVEVQREEGLRFLPRDVGRQGRRRSTTASAAGRSARVDGARALETRIGSARSRLTVMGKVVVAARLPGRIDEILAGHDVVGPPDGEARTAARRACVDELARRRRACWRSCRCASTMRSSTVRPSCAWSPTTPSATTTSISRRRRGAASSSPTRPACSPTPPPI